ncbi:unnamed protein product [Rhizoctonia solani]|uniref:BTB domain-containing protein n=1 Tax=Rhizoctonia solani TaxID=456999 RepID=A0A8H3DWH6_9AGAM|nr:unnamed protein product [Rhizoctonia solani]
MLSYNALISSSPPNPQVPNAPTSTNPQEVLPSYDFVGTIIKLQVNDVVFRIPEPQISKFASLKKLVEDARKADPHNLTLTITVRDTSELASDFLSTFSLFDTLVGLVDSSTESLISAARISTKYDYPKLRTLCIQELEKRTIGTMDRLRIGRTLGLTSWEDRACKELSERAEMITREEMLALGVDAYFQVASAREKQLRDERYPPKPTFNWRRDED